MKSQIREAFFAFLADPLKEENLIGALEKDRQKWLQNRQQEHDQRWRNNVAFYAGSHYVREKTNSSQYRVRLRENHTNNVINRMVSIFVQNMPVVRAFPASDDSQDVSDADACEKWLKYDWRLKAMEQKYAKLVKYAAIFGNAFSFRCYDPYAGGMMNLSSAETGNKEQSVKWRGDVKVDIDDPLKILVRPGIEEMEDHFDFFRSVVANKADIDAQYGESDGGWITKDLSGVTMMNAYTGNTRNDEDMTLVHHYYHKPTHWWEEGCYVCYSGKKILKAVKFPYACGKLPLEHLPFDKPPMRFWALSTIDQIIDLQEQLNRAASMIIEGRNLLARPRWWVPNTAKVTGQEISDVPGTLNRYDGATAPTGIVTSFNFAEMASHKGDVRAALQQVSGMSGASRGEIPAATKTALALQLVLEQDRSQWAPFIKQFYAVIRATELGKLEIAAEYFPENDPRVFKIEGETGSKMFHGGMVPSPLDVYLEDTNPLGWTAGGRIERIESLYQSGVIKDENKILEMLSLTNDDPSYKSEKASRMCAKKENEALNRGELVEVGSEDIDPIHLDEHVNEMIQFSFKSKPQPVKDAFEAHANAHKARLAPPPGAPGMGAPLGGGMPSLGSPPQSSFKPTEGGGRALDALKAGTMPQASGPEAMNALITGHRAG